MGRSWLPLPANCHQCPSVYSRRAIGWREQQQPDKAACRAYGTATAAEDNVAVALVCTKSICCPLGAEPAVYIEQLLTQLLCACGALFHWNKRWLQSHSLLAICCCCIALSLSLPLSFDCLPEVVCYAEAECVNELDHYALNWYFPDCSRRSCGACWRSRNRSRSSIS